MAVMVHDLSLCESFKLAPPHCRLTWSLSKLLQVKQDWYSDHVAFTRIQSRHTNIVCEVFEDCANSLVGRLTPSWEVAILVMPS
jgi:hypothetical protein